MKIEALKSERIEDFVNYCKKHRQEVDESFLYEEDLEDFQPDDDNPTYVAIDEQDSIIAVISLIMDDYNRRGRKARFRIFHSKVDDAEIYDKLLQAILKHVDGIDKLNHFVPTVNKKLAEFMEGLNFNVERYSYLLLRDEKNTPDFSLPEGYEIRTFRPGIDEETWCEVRNPSFATLKGNETPMTPEGVKKMVSGKDNIDGGMLILYHHEKPVGVVRGSNDEYEGATMMNIGPLAIIPEYQGRGLGRILLRASLKFAEEKRYERTVLCVNAENERAKALYIQEGFKEIECVTCYKYDLK